jgi:hypothetical protein
LIDLHPGNFTGIFFSKNNKPSLPPIFFVK